MIRLPSPVSVLLLAVAACSSGSGGEPAAVGPSSIGTVNVVVDTATGSDAVVQVQVVGATLEQVGGGATGNLLAAPEMLTLADPSGELDALTLRSVPTGDYTTLHLLFAPGSGVALYGDGRILPVNLVTDLVVPFAEVLEHSAQGRSWVEIGHDGASPPAAALQASWQPSMSGRPSGSTIVLEGLQIAAVVPEAVTVLWATADDAPLQVEFEAGCTFEDEGGRRGDRGHFQRTIGRGDDLRIEGDLDYDGRLRARHAGRRGHGNDGPRLIGRITELRPAAAAFLMDVLAETRRGHRRLLPRPESVLVLADAARIHWSGTRRTLTFAELQVGQLTKVEGTRRVPGGGLEEVVASEIEVAGSGVPMRPSWRGSVQGVDVVAGRIVVVPDGAPIVVQGQSVPQVDVLVLATTVLLRHESRQGRTTIGIGDLVPGQDHICWRGEVTGATSIDATLVIVRRDD